MQRYWLTASSVLLGGILAFSAIGAAFFGTDISTAGRVVFAIVFGLSAISLFAGLWSIRTGRLEERQSLELVSVGLVVNFYFFFLVVPVILGALVLWFGVFKRGLVGELRSAPS